MFIGSKLVDMLGPLACRNHHIQDRTLEAWERIQHVEQLPVSKCIQHVEQIQASKCKDLWVSFCYHTLRVGNGKVGHQQGIESARGT